MSYNAQFVEALKEALNGLRTIHSVGEEWCSYIGKIPVGGVPYCGQEVQRDTYSALWQYAQNQGLVKSESEWQSIYAAQGGNVPYYSSGDGSSTFRMPRVVGYVRGASGQSEAGAYIKEGLPNITGMAGAMSNYLANNLVYDGAFKTLSTTKSVASGGITGTPEVDFDASRSNPIYGNSSHVTPETSVVLFGVYAFGEVSNVDALDAGTLASALARVESNLSNLSGVVKSVNGVSADSSGDVNTIDFFTPDYTAPIDGTGTKFTAPSNGLIMLRGYIDTDNTVYVTINGVRHKLMSSFGDRAKQPYVLKKGDVISFDFSNDEAYTFWPMRKQP